MFTPDIKQRIIDVSNLLMDRKLTTGPLKDAFDTYAVACIDHFKSQDEVPPPIIIPEKKSSDCTIKNVYTVYEKKKNVH